MQSLIIAELRFLVFSLHRKIDKKFDNDDSHFFQRAEIWSWLFKSARQMHQEKNYHGNPFKNSPD